MKFGLIRVKQNNGRVGLLRDGATPVVCLKDWKPGIREGMEGNIS